MSSFSIDVVLWDWNGTLLDDGDFGRDVIDRLLSVRGMRIPDREEHARLFDFPVIRYYERLGFDFEKEPFEVVSQEFIDAYYAGVERCSLKPSSREILEQLKAGGYRQSILSASKQDHLEGLVGYYGLEPYFEELLGIDSIHAPGKAGRGYDWIVERKLDPRTVVLIGDTVHDAEVADRMGIHSILVEGGHHPKEKLAGTGKPVLQDITQVPEALERFSLNMVST